MRVPVTKKSFLLRLLSIPDVIICSFYIKSDADADADADADICKKLILIFDVYLLISHSQTKGQIKSLLKINEEGAKFRSYIDGSLHFITPEISIEIQRKLGADLIVVLDECTPFNVEKE